MIFNEIKYHFNTSLGLVGGCTPASPLCPRLGTTLLEKSDGYKLCVTCRL